MFGKLLLIFIFPIVCIFAHDSCDQRTMRREALSHAIVQIITKQVESVQYYNGGKLYLKPEKIHNTSAGLVLCHNNSAILLQDLSIDSAGYYLPCRSRDDYRFRCPDCGMRWWFSDDWSIYCPACGTPGD